MGMTETKPLTKFDVGVCRIGYGFGSIEVQASSQEEANEKALDEAGDHLFSEKTSEYVLEGEPSPYQALLLSQIEAWAASLQTCGRALRFKPGGLSGQDHDALKAAEEALAMAGVKSRIFK